MYFNEIYGIKKERNLIYEQPGILDWLCGSYFCVYVLHRNQTAAERKESRN